MPPENRRQNGSKKNAEVLPEVSQICCIEHGDGSDLDADKPASLANENSKASRSVDRTLQYFFHLSSSFSLQPGQYLYVTLCSQVRTKARTAEDVVSLTAFCRGAAAANFGRRGAGDAMIVCRSRLIRGKRPSLATKLQK